ncbi:hypothetical protein [Mycobacterium sp. SA01]|uniref:hypothetical protein n=1 Tax=Mycobacterium sp. SA01 TaxID=3238820 RepID=UPI00351B167C
MPTAGTTRADGGVLLTVALARGTEGSSVVTAAAGLTGAMDGAWLTAAVTADVLWSDLAVLFVVAEFLAPLGLRAACPLAPADRGFCRAVLACPVDFAGPLAAELFVVDPLASDEPLESADATAGSEAMAAPTPRATAEAPSQVKNRALPVGACLGGVIPPNSAGSNRTSDGWLIRA